MHLNMAFKGQRDYLQGPDLVAGLLGALDRAGTPATGAVDVAFYRKAGNQPDVGVLEAEDGNGKPQEAFGHWSATCGPDRRQGWFLQTARPVAARKPYDEDSVVASCERGQDFIVFRRETLMTATELCVAMAKALHIARFPLTADKHWVVCRLELDRPLVEGDKQDMRVALETTLGLRLTKSGLCAGETRLGSIYFSPAPR